eukprot:5287221-Pleurochrysis_carterae.AAC.1
MAPAPPVAKSLRTCQALSSARGGWAVRTGPHGTAVCADSTHGAARCLGPVPLGRAIEICRSEGARLCTADELSADAAAHSGCEYDGARVWSATP